MTGTVARVIDGDTIDVRQTDYARVRVRIWGIDAPETQSRPRRPVSPEHAARGIAAARWARERFMGMRVTCRIRDTDRYGRVVAQCWQADVPMADLALLLVCAGHARDWPRYSRGYYRGACI